MKTPPVPPNPELERAFAQELAESLRVRSRWLLGGTVVIWVISLLWFDQEVFPSRSFTWMIRGPEIASAALLLFWLRKPRELRAIEAWTVAAWGVMSAMSGVGLTVIPHEKLPAKVASLAISIAVVLALGAYSWVVTLVSSVFLALALSVLFFRGETQLFMLSATAFGFAFGMLVVSAAARDRLKRAEFFSRRALLDANERLRREDEIRRRLFVNLSHDFRTPLAIIQGEASLLRALHGGDSAAALARIEGNAQSLADLTEQLLDLARLDAGQMPLRTRRCDVAQASREVAALLAPVTPERSLVARSINPAPVASVDPGHLRRILCNLVANSLRHAHHAVEIEVNRVGDRVRIEVADDGAGVPPERRAAIFERFVSFSEGQGASSGIGLPLARELAALNGGSLDLVDDAPRTTFRLELPSCQGPADALEPLVPLASAPPAVEMPRLSPLAPRVLVVEDNPAMGSLLRRVLQDSFVVDVAGSVQEGLARARENPPRVILCDVMLPDGTGYDLLATIRSRLGIDAPPVLLVSALAEVEQRVQGLAAGADDYITKPFAPEELRERVAAAVERSDRRRRALDLQRDALLMEIHDGVSASLTRAAMLLDKQGPKGAEEGDLTPVLGAIRDGLNEVRSIGGILSPQPCDWGALSAEIRRSTADACAAAAITLDFESSLENPRLQVPVVVAHTLRRFAREVTTNTLKHARAQTLSCRMNHEDGWRIRMEDDGQGLPEVRTGGQGLSIMQRRASRLGGVVSFGNREQGGAFFTIHIPRQD